jgi:rubrerythrin
MYGNNKPLQSNKNTNNLLKNITVNNAEGENVNVNKNNSTKIKNIIQTEKDAYKNMLPEVTTPSVFGFGGILLLTAFIVILMTIIYFRDSIVNYFKLIKNSLTQGISETTSSPPYKSLEEKYDELMKQMLDKTAENDQQRQSKNHELDKMIKNKEQNIEELNKSIKEKEEEHQKKQSEISSGAIGQVNNKLSDMCKFKTNTKVLKDGYCYIGYDLGKRECTDVYAGDICMSGKIFPTLAQCQNPKLRS